jgi:hypothetical protein
MLLSGGLSISSPGVSETTSLKAVTPNEESFSKEYLLKAVTPNEEFLSRVLAEGGTPNDGSSQWRNAALSQTCEA